MSKNELRQHHINLRNLMSQSDIHNKSSEIIKKITVQKWFADVDIIFSYKAFNSEVTLEELTDSGKIIALPQVVNATTMVFRIVSQGTQFKKSGYGILEPVDGPIVEPTEQSVILVPASCFDMKGNRIGYGGGYYDRYLGSNTFRGKRVGICYNHQITQSIPVEAHDVVVDAIITESQVIDINSKTI